jgi:hypothetical protein
VLLCLPNVVFGHLLGTVFVGDLTGVAENIDCLPSVAMFLGRKGSRQWNHVIGEDAVMEGILPIEHDFTELVRIIRLEEQFLVLEAAFHSLVQIIDVLDFVAYRDDADATVDFSGFFSPG